MDVRPEIWEVDVKGTIYETDLDALIGWIGEGAVGREDLVRRGNLRWLEAGKVPKLVTFFNQYESGAENRLVTTTSSPEIPAASAEFIMSANDSADFSNDLPAVSDLAAFSLPVTAAVPSGGVAEAVLQTENPVETVVNRFEKQPKIGKNPNVCQVHTQAKSAFLCVECDGRFCGACPKTYGGTVKTCPECGGLCQAIAGEIPRTMSGGDATTPFANLGDSFGFSEFGAALRYPFQYKTSLISGGIMFMFFTLGQSAGSFGGIYMMFAALFCLMLANTLTFGILANTVNNFSQGLTDRNFMPSWDDFELWDDVIHPFFLSIGVYLVSFGLFIVLLIGSVWYVARTFTESIPQQPTAAAAAIPYGDAEGGTDAEDQLADARADAYDEEAEIQNVQKLIDAHRKNQLESIAGQDPTAGSGPLGEMGGKLLKFAVPFLVLASILVLWGFFYLPAACLVAGYTRSFSATLNPLNGLDTIKRLGGDYFKILLMALILMLFAAIVSGVLNLVFKPFDMPFFGNLPAIALGSLGTFYFSIVFSVILGYALLKNSAKLNLFSQ